MSKTHPALFSAAERETWRERILDLARADARLTAAAEVGSRAAGQTDRFSDIDLTFAVAAGFTVDEVAADWSQLMADRYAATHLVDARRDTSLYRVFLLPGMLQCDLSFTPEADFGARGPRFKLLYGQTNRNQPALEPKARDLFGWAVHHALRARFCIERGQLWQAEYWLSGLRDDALNIVCLKAGLPAAHGRGYDQLPPELLKEFEAALPRALERTELLRALTVAVDSLLSVAQEPEVATLAASVADQLWALTEPF